MVVDRPPRADSMGRRPLQIIGSYSAFIMPTVDPNWLSFRGCISHCQSFSVDPTEHRSSANNRWKWYVNEYFIGSFLYFTVEALRRLFIEGFLLGCFVFRLALLSWVSLGGSFRPVNSHSLIQVQACLPWHAWLPYTVLDNHCGNYPQSSKS